MFGFLKGKMKIVLENYNFKEGDTIQGQVLFTLKKPAESRELTIRLVAYQRNRTSRGSSTFQKIHDFKMILDQEKSYPASQEINYNFQVAIPKNILSGVQIDPRLKSIVKAASMLTGMGSSIKWYLEGRLNMPGFDLTKKVQINVT